MANFACKAIDDPLLRLISAAERAGLSRSEFEARLVELFGKVAATEKIVGRQPV
nr:hypothetical protein [uncultured Rhodopila sp.]